ncbi:hypothetical protein D3C78_563220 [compost metagenome]
MHGMHMACIFHRLAGRRQRLADHLTTIELGKAEILTHTTEQVFLDRLQPQQGHQIVQNPSHGFSFEVSV